MSRKQKRNLAKIITAAGLFFLSWVFMSLPEIMMMLLLTSYIVAGYDVLLSAGRKILSGQIFDEEILMTVATVGALLMKEFSEAAVVMILFQTGELFQSIAVGKSRRSIKELMKIKPDSATVLRNGEEIRVSPDEVEKGELVLVIPGEKVPLDGMIEDGESSFDSSSLTGESEPLEIKKGEKAFSGMINIDSPVKIRVSGVYAESTVAKILQLMETSSSHKSQSEKFITKFSRKYTPCVFIAALLTLIVPTIIFGQSFSVWAERALIFLVVSCPCALVISVPLSFFGGMGAASKKGILIKGSNYLEALSGVSKIAFDKTGTLTRGGFSVTKVSAAGDSEASLIETAALAESFSNHPVALSIIDFYGKPLQKERVENALNLPGNGIKAVIDGEEVLLGNSRLMAENAVEVPVVEEEGTAVYVSSGGKYIGHICLKDSLKEDAKDAVEVLRKKGIKRIVMLTGDNENAAQSIAREAGIDEYYSKLLPQDKVNIALKIKEEGRGLFAFVGDGINDAPVLSCADVGVAMGALGSDAAIEAADVVIMNDSPSALADAVAISGKTMRIVRQNIIFSLAVKFGVMILSAAGYGNMYAAVFADVGVMIIAVLNATRLLSLKK